MVDHEFTIGVEVTNLEEVKQLRKELERIKELKKELEKDDEEDTSPLDIPDDPFPSRRTKFWVEDADETFGPEEEFEPHNKGTGFYMKTEEDEENVIADTQFEI